MGVPGDEDGDFLKKIDLSLVQKDLESIVKKLTDGEERLVLNGGKYMGFADGIV